jgi:hypothetical protein
MKNPLVFLIVATVLTASPAFSGQSKADDQLSPEEIAAAEASPSDIGVVSLGASITHRLGCSDRAPSESIYTPAGWLSTMSRQAKKQFLPYNPTLDETARVLTVISRGCVGATPAGPFCESITRSALLSDKTGTIVVEAVAQQPYTQTWHNGYGAATSCTFLLSRFLLSDVKKVQQANGEFMIATFNGSALLEIYTVEERQVKKLGL